MKIINLISLVSAHTGNDTVNHSFEIADGIVGILILIFLIIIITLITKRYKRKRN